MNVKTVSFRIKEPAALNYSILKGAVLSFFRQNMRQVAGPFIVDLFGQQYYVSRVYHRSGITAVVGVKTEKNPGGYEGVLDVNVELASDLTHLDDLSRRVTELYEKRQEEVEVDAKHD